MKLGIKDLIKYGVIIAMVIAVVSLLSVKKGVIPASISLDTVDTYRDINDKLRAQIVQKVISSDNHHIIDSLENVIKGLKKSDVKSVSVIESEAKVVVRDTVIYKDSTYQLFRKDDWLDLVVKLNKDTGTVAFSLRDSLTIVEFEKRKLFSTTRILDISHSSPYFSTKRAGSYTIQDRLPILTIGPSVNFGYDGQWRTTFGISVQVPLIKINKPR